MYCVYVCLSINIIYIDIKQKFQIPCCRRRRRMSHRIGQFDFYYICPRRVLGCTRIVGEALAGMLWAENINIEIFSAFNLKVLRQITYIEFSRAAKTNFIYYLVYEFFWSILSAKKIQRNMFAFSRSRNVCPYVSGERTHTRRLFARLVRSNSRKHVSFCNLH